MARPNQFAKRSLGQNFLTDPAAIERIVAAVELSAGDTVIEIGPGRGALTEKLVESGANVIAIELDRDLVPFLRDKFSDRSNFQIIEEDALEIDYASLLNTDGLPAKVVANLPYYISTAILQRLAEQRTCFSSLVLMFQREVVDRITAVPGDSNRGFLTVLVEEAFLAEKLFDVPPTAFEPQPKVWSSVVRLVPSNSIIGPPESFRRLVSAAFAQKRKTILNNLRPVFPNAEDLLRSAGIDPQRRAETLTLLEWKAILDVLI